MVLAPEKANKLNTGIAARNAALKRLSEAHEAEFTRYLHEERESRGLPPDQEEAKREKRIENLRQKLKELGYEGEV